MAPSPSEATETKPANVIEALARVMGDLPGIGKDQTASAQQGGYAYRGIEQITMHTQGLFAKYGVVFTPHVLSYEIRELTVNGKPWTDTIEFVEYTVYGPGGVQDFIKVGPLLSIGRDNSDKGANKCLTQAYKYALLQALSISDAKDDGDNASHEADTRQQVNPAAAALADRVQALPEDKRDALLAYVDKHAYEGVPTGIKGLYGLSDAWIARLEELVAKAEAKPEPAPEPVEPAGEPVPDLKALGGVQAARQALAGTK